MCGARGVARLILEELEHLDAVAGHQGVEQPSTAEVARLVEVDAAGIPRVDRVLEREKSDTSSKPSRDSRRACSPKSDVAEALAEVKLALLGTYRDGRARMRLGGLLAGAGRRYGERCTREGERACLPPRPCFEGGQHEAVRFRSVQGASGGGEVRRGC